MQFSIVINHSIDTVFSLIADLKNYGKWLPASNIYSEVTQVSEDDVKLGTTYIDKGSSTVMHRKITEFHPPCHITFSQTTQFKLLMFNAGIDIQIQYTLQTVENRAQVTRDFTLYVLGIVKLMQPVLVSTIQKENERILQVMKTYLEAQP